MHSLAGTVHPWRLSSIGLCGGSGGDMNKNVVAAAVFLMCAGTAHGADKEKEPSAILEIGGASEWSLQNGGASVGPSIAVEVEPIKEWLELEAGFSPLLKKGSSPEWSTDLLFKKPFTLSNSVEFMFGAGPEWTYTDRGSKIAAEFALDFMFWPSPDRKLGWFLEPTYSYSFSKGHEQAAAISVGLLIPIP
jgi:hypothetical protein